MFSPCVCSNGMGESLKGVAIALQCRSSDLLTRERCFRRIWEAYYARLAVFVRGARGPGPDDEDLVQEIMEKIWRGILGYDPAWCFSTWVYTIARNACRDRARRRLVRPETVPLSEHHGRSAGPGPEEALIRGESERLVDRFFASADTETRQIAFLRFHEQLGYREISSVMGIPVGTAKFRIHAIRGKLKAAMGGEDADRRPVRAQVF